MASSRSRSVVLLWVLAPILLGLSLYRPFTPSRGLARSLPVALPGYEMTRDRELTERQTQLLGTDDAAWRTYVGEDGSRIFFVAVFHEENWKSVHPPRICIEGSDMAIREEGDVEFGEAGAPIHAGRIVAYSRSNKLEYLSLFVYGAPALRTATYFSWNPWSTSFFWHHAPRALLRRGTPGFLLRVETFVMGEGGRAAAEQRCRDFLAKILPAAEALVQR